MNKILLLFILFCVVTVFSGFCQEISPAAVAALIERTDNKMAPEEYESFLVIKDYKPNNKVTEERSHFYRKGDKMIGVVVSPAKQQGQVFLRNGDDMWLYLPKSKKLTRIGAKETSRGGEASNADILRVDLAEDYNGTYLGYETIDGQICYKLELKAKDRTIAYDKVLYWISKDTELPVRREYFSLSGRRLKSMTFQDTAQLAGNLRPRLMTIENERSSEFKTEIYIESMTAAPGLNDNMFTPSYVQRGTLK